ncbi:MAG: tol-pal system protein YbgF [Chlorobium sp.]|nr:MAG: tol-pal system protein YbgF [Chlorobium sp.]
MNNKIRPFFIVSLLGVSACASQQDLTVVQSDMQKLKTDTETVKTQTAGSYSDIQQMHDEIAYLKGRIEEINHNNYESFGRLGMEDSLLVHKVDQLETRLQKIEQYLGLGEKPSVPPQTQVSAALPSSSQSTAPKPAETLKKPVEIQSDTGLFKDGLDKLNRKNYTAARESFSTLIQKFPKSELADDAQFDIAECFFNEKWYEKAILEYQVVIAKYQKSNKRPAALYKQALSFEMIGDKTNAQARYKDIVKLYPKSSEAILAHKKLQ